MSHGRILHATLTVRAAHLLALRGAGQSWLHVVEVEKEEGEPRKGKQPQKRMERKMSESPSQGKY